MRIALCQINTVVGDIEGNIKKILDFYKKACNEKADIAVFPELTIAGYPPMDLLDRSDFVDECNIAIKEKIVPKVKGDCALLIGTVTRNKNDGKPYKNSAVFIGVFGDWVCLAGLLLQFPSRIRKLKNVLNEESFLLIVTFSRFLSTKYPRKSRI